MNRPSKFAVSLALASLVPLPGKAQSPEHYVAQVKVVSGVCRECPHGHPEHSRVVTKGTLLAADDDIQCERAGYVVASYRDSPTSFHIEGEAWQPVGLPGAGGSSDPQQPREGRIAYSTVDEAEIAAADIVRDESNASMDISNEQPVEIFKSYGAVSVPPKEDRALAERVRTTLVKDSVDVKNIQVTATHGKVVLQGTAVDKEQLKKALELTKNIEGVTSVDNRLLVMVVEAQRDGAAVKAQAPAAAQAAPASPDSGTATESTPGHWEVHY
ncbi:BON domain-containing protein [Paraburkholderia sp. BR10937]|uniref:BON domain-containing protein n=1 Tax=Paraburkholderia sp. BR10937 TaxID=3236994 RepID=UPI0034D31B79